MILAVLGSVLLSPGCDENKRATFVCIGLTKVRLQDMSHFSTPSIMISTHPTDLHSFLYTEVHIDTMDWLTIKASPVVLHCVPVN